MLSFNFPSLLVSPTRTVSSYAASLLLSQAALGDLGKSEITLCTCRSLSWPYQTSEVQKNYPDPATVLWILQL